MRKAWGVGHKGSAAQSAITITTNGMRKPHEKGRQTTDSFSTDENLNIETQSDETHRII